MKERLKLGILGLSEDNGHPYSWSAIFNGYDLKTMLQCPFPLIPAYLARRQFPEDAIAEARVTHIWTQERSISEHLAKACHIDHIVDDYEEIIGRVDAILLARDDAENHLAMSRPFLKAGLPIYIDKPLAYDVETAEKIFSLEQYPGQIFSCSAMRYAKEFQLSSEDRERIGPIRRIEAVVMKKWDKYGVHIIEPVLKILGHLGAIEEIINNRRGEEHNVTVKWRNGVEAQFTALGQTKKPITIRLIGPKGQKEMIFKDTFYAFKKTLQTFVNMVFKKEKAPSKEFVLKVVEIIEGGLVYV